MDYAYIETKEIAKEVRKDLKAAYPSVKFSVTSKHNSLNISWTDGVTKNEVETIALKYSGRSDYDSNYCDYKKNNPIQFQGKQVKTYLEFVFCDRDFSVEYLQEVAGFVDARYGHNDKVTVERSPRGNAYFGSSDAQAVRRYRETAHKYNSLESIAVQVKREDDKKKAEAEIKRQEEAIINAEKEIKPNVVKVDFTLKQVEAIAPKRKGLRVDVLRRANGSDCTKKGLTSKYDQLTLVGEGIPEIFEETEDAPAIEFCSINVYGKEHLYCKPAGSNHTMMGGNFVFTSDSRFPMRYPLPVHDRIESVIANSGS